MMQVEGYVQAIDTVPTRTGKTMYNVRVNGEKYGAGMYPPKFKQGDFISFTATMNGQYKNMETRTVTIKAAPPGMAPPGPVTGTGTGTTGGNAGGGGWDARQDTISKQAALNSAMSMVNILVTTGGVVGLDKAKTAADKASVINNLVNEFTKDFYFQNTGRELKLPEAPLNNDTPDYGEEELPRSGGGWE